MSRLSLKTGSHVIACHYPLRPSGLLLSLTIIGAPRSCATLNGLSDSPCNPPQTPNAAERPQQPLANPSSKTHQTLMGARTEAAIGVISTVSPGCCPSLLFSRQTALATTRLPTWLSKSISVPRSRCRKVPFSRLTHYLLAGNLLSATLHNSRAIRGHCLSF